MHHRRCHAWYLIYNILNIRVMSHYGDVKWSSWRLELPVHRVCSRVFFLADNNETSKIRVTVHLWGESTGDRWFPAQRESNTENVSIWWRNNVKVRHSIHRETVFSVFPIPTENKQSCFHPRIAVSIMPVISSIIKSIPLLNYRMYVLFGRTKFMPDDYGLCTPGCSWDLSVLSFSDLRTS